MRGEDDQGSQNAQAVEKNGGCFGHERGAEACRKMSQGSRRKNFHSCAAALQEFQFSIFKRTVIAGLAGFPFRVLRVANAAPDHPHQIKQRVLFAVHANIDELQGIA